MRNVFIENGAAVLAVILWGSAPAIIVTLYDYLKPMDIVFPQFVIAYVVMCIAHRKPLRPEKKIHELYFFLTGFLGITASVGLLNTAYTFASSGTASVIYSTSPLVVVLIYMIIRRKAYVGIRYWSGGLMALAGCAIVSMVGDKQYASLTGIVLAFSSAAAWALYVVIYDQIQKESDYPINGLLRRMFFYGFLTAFIVVMFTDSNLSIDVLLHGNHVMILILAQGIFMGAGAYLLWNWSCGKLGAARTSIYLYGMPFVTLIVAAIFLSEELSAIKMLGCVITVAGVVLSQSDKGI